MAEAAEGGAARLSGSEEGEGKRSDWDGEAKDGGGGRSKAKLPTADRSRASPGAESSRSPRSCSDPRPTKPEAAEAAPTGAESCRRSPKPPKPRRLERKAAAGARSSRSRADRSGKLPPKLFSAPCRPSCCLCALFHVKHLFCIVSRGTFCIVSRETFCIVSRETLSFIITNCFT